MLPARAASGLWSAVGWVAGAVFRVRRRQVDENVELAFPEESERWRDRVAVEAYRHLGREIGAILRVTRNPQPATALRALAVFDDDASRETFAWVQERTRHGQGVLLVSGHLGSWEVGGGGLAALGLPLDVVAVKLRNPLLQRDLSRYRQALGMRVIDRNEAPRRVLTALREGRAIGVVADQNARQAGVLVRYFGRLASTPRGPAVFALRTGAPLLLCTIVRAAGSSQRYAVHLERVPVVQTGDVERDVMTITQAIATLLEAQVRRAPGQYLWHHRRWRELPGPAAALTAGEASSGEGS